MKKKNYLFKLLSMTMVAVMSVGFMGCGSDDSSDPDNVSVSQSSANFMESGGSQSISIKSNTNWTVSGAPAWLMVSPVSGSGNGTINLMAQTNTDAARQATLYINAGSASATVLVSQSGKSVPTGVTVTNNSIYVLERFRVVMLNSKMETLTDRDFGTLSPGNSVTMDIPTGATEYYMATYLYSTWFFSPNYDIQYSSLSLSTDEIGGWKSNSSAPKLLNTFIGE